MSALISHSKFLSLTRPVSVPVCVRVAQRCLPPLAAGLLSPPDPSQQHERGDSAVPSPADKCAAELCLFFCCLAVAGKWSGRRHD